METFSVKLSRMETQTALRRFRYYSWTKKKSNHFGKKLKSLTSVDENVEKRKCYPLLVAVQFFFFFFFHLQFFKTNLYWSIAALQCCQFLLYSKVSQLYIYIPPIFFWIFFPFRSPESIEFPVLYQSPVLTSYLFYTQYQQCMYEEQSVVLFNGFGKEVGIML